MKHPRLTVLVVTFFQIQVQHTAVNHAINSVKLQHHAVLTNQHIYITDYSLMAT
jgi:hypothetical protein